MSKIWEPLTIETYQSWVKAIQEEASDDLNEWEATFVEDIGRKLDRGWILTQSQADKLESIYAEKTK